MILTKEVFVASHTKTLISAKIRVSAPLNSTKFLFCSILYRLQNAPLHRLLYWKPPYSRSTACALCIPFERSIPAQLCSASRLNCQQRSDQSCWIFLCRHTDILKFNFGVSLRIIFVVTNELAWKCGLLYIMNDYRLESPPILRDFLSYHETIKAPSQKTVDE